MKELPPSEFESNSSALTKPGKPAAKPIPASSPPDDVFGYMTGKVKVVGDIVGPVTPTEDWETG